MIQRISNDERARLFGPPCRREPLRRVEVWGLRPVVHHLVQRVFVLACQDAHWRMVAAGIDGYLPLRIDSFVCRNIAGTQRRSLHAWGLAWDIFRTPPDVPPPGGVYQPTARLHPLFIAAFEDAGFTWGGRWRRPDEPHFEWSGAPPR